MKKKALIIGINEYPGCHLEGCINDARSIAKVLERNGDEKKNFDINLQENIQTKSQLLRQIDMLFKGTSDIALLYFSGHGYINELGGYIVTPDYSEYDMGVSMSDILKYANESNCKNKVIILDCCHSGAIGNLQNINNSVSVVGGGVTILTASRDDESAMEIDGHGVFTNLLLEALKGGASNLQGKITPGGIYAYIDQALGEWEQRPVFKTNIYEFVSLRDVIPRVSHTEMNVLLDCFKSRTYEFKLDPSFEYTNTFEEKHKIIEPYANSNNVMILKKLQKLESVGLVEPVDEEHMYFAAMNSKSCRLTPLGQYYWQLLKEDKI